MGGPGSGGPRTDAEGLERRRRAVELRLAGATYAQIAEKLGYASRQTAHSAVKDALAASGSAEQRQEERETELARLDALLIALWPKARRGDLQAIDRVLKIGERRAAVLARDVVGEVDQEEPEGTVLDDFTRRLRDRQANTPSPGGAGAS